MKNWFPTLLGAGVIAGGLALTSCEDEFTEADAIALQDSTLTALKKLDNANAVALDQLDHEQAMAFQKYQDSLERIGPVVNYSVMVIAGGSANTNARTEGEAFAEGATVTVVQGGVSRTETTSGGGVATFGDMRIGEAVVTVEAPDHTTVTYTTSLGTTGYAYQEDNVETTIPIFPLTVEAGASEVSGIAWAELDLTNDEPEFATGATVRATISVANALNSYGIFFSSDKGGINSASYSDFVKTATVGEDGRYSLIIPNGNADNGEGISADIEFLPFKAEQTYAVWQGDSLAVVSKEVIFDPNGSGNNSDSHLDFDLPSVYLEIGTPTGTASGLELVAEATRVNFTSNSDVLVDKRGTGYTVGDKFNFSADADDNAAYIQVTSVDGDGAITNWTIVDNGATYSASPTLTQDAAATGTGAAFLVNFHTMYEIKIASEGSGYWEVPEVVMTYNYYDNGVLIQDAYDDNLNADVVAGKIKDTNSDNVIETVWSATAPVINILPLETRQAIIDLDEYFINDKGQVEGDDDDLYIYLYDEDRGDGYVTTPTVTFKSIGSMGSGATGVAWVDGGEIDYITITNPGSGYMDNVNDFTYSVAASATQSASKQFKPASSNSNYNFDFGTGVVNQ